MQAISFRQALRAYRPEVWEPARLAFAPDAWRGRVSDWHSRLGGSWSPAANDWLLTVTERMAGIRLPVSLTDTEICDVAVRCAREALNLADGPVIHTVTDLRGRLDAYVRSYGIDPPAPLKVSRRGTPVGVTDQGAVARMTDAQWWRRALRRSQARAIEREAIGLGYVHRRAEVYASDVTVERRAQQKRRNAKALEATQAVNLDTGEIYSLAELAEKANSNPAIRRGELMTRISGFEAIARDMGHAADFWTITTPSKYHAKLITGADNPKYRAGITPRDAQGYLTATWAKCRAALKRVGAAIYGFRIAEPHHDGTTHWHCLFFMPAEQVAEVRRIIGDYFLREDGDEAGAAKNRTEVKAIDWSRGTAAGYLAKYVSKNIDGFQVQGDFEGENMSAVTGSQRVEAWASTWGIRQFQQIGGAPVGVWRELRRMRDQVKAAGDEFEQARAAADAGNWRRYVEAQGGPTVERRALRFRVVYTRPGERWDNKAGEPLPANPTRYGETAPGAVYGVCDVLRDVSHVSRFFQWEIRRAGGGNVFLRGGESAGVAMVGGDSPAMGQGSAGALCEGGNQGSAVFLGGSGFGVPWTRVNNCTQEDVEDGKAGAGISPGSNGNGRQGGGDSLGGGSAACPGDGGGIRESADGCASRDGLGISPGRSDGGGSRCAGNASEITGGTDSWLTS